MHSGRAFTVFLALAAGVALTFLALPIVALFTEVPLRQVPALLRDPAVRDAIGVTVRTNAIANVLIVAIGTPVGYLLATRAFRGRSLAITLVELPLVLPPAVAGIGLLAAFGATIVFAGNVRGETQTLTLGIYEQLDANFDLALAIGILLVVLSGSVLLSYKMLSTWRRSSSTSPAPFAPTSSMSA